MPGKTKDAKTRLEENSSLEDWSGYVLLGGLMLETAILFAYPDGKSLLHISLEAVAYILVFGGVFGEVLFATAARKASDELSTAAELQIAQLSTQAAEANAKAAQAQLELAKFKAPRSLTPTQAGILASIVRPFPKTPFSCLVAPGPEPLAFLEQISAVLTQEGWERVKCETTSGIEVSFVDKPSAGIVLAVEGVVIEIAEQKKHEWLKPMEAILKAFLAIGHVARGNIVSPGDKIMGSLRISVGAKP